MKVIPPLEITDARLTSSTGVEVAPAAWSGATTYASGNTCSVAGAAGLRTCYKSLQNGNLNNAPGSSPAWWQNLGDTYQSYSGAATYALADRVIDPAAHLIYESLAAGNVGNALSNATKWLVIGPTNKWAMFDALRNTATIAASPLVVTLTPGVRIDAIAALGLVATSIAVSVVESGATVYSKSVTLNERFVGDWRDYFFAPFSTQQSFAAFDLPPYSGGVTTITIANDAGMVECAALVIGSQVDIGRVQYSAESDVLNFSTVERDFDGGTSSMVRRRNVPRTIQQIVADKSTVNRVRALRDSLNASPAVWSGLDDASNEYFEALLIVGFYKRFSINLAYPEHAIISLELEEI